MAAALGLLLASRGLHAQLQTGEIRGNLRDPQGDPLAGVQVTLTGPGAPEVLRSDAGGRFRFLDLPPGVYRIEASADGFGKLVYRDLPVRVGQSTALDLELIPAFTEVIEVSPQAPLLELRKVSTGANLTQTELEKIPAARDIWDTIRQVPGVLTDRINIAGDESVEPAVIVGPGAQMSQNAWAIDGVVITDPLTLGAPASFFDFDAFEEVQVTTGGDEVSLPSSGTTVNLVTRRGTNLWRGSARALVADDSWQSGLDLDASELGAPGPWNLGNGQQVFAQGDRTARAQEVGVEGGGPVVDDRLWAWAAWGRQDIDQLTIGDFHSDTDIDILTIKADARWGANGSLAGFYMDSDRDRIGRDVGPLRPPETAWTFPVHTDIGKLEGSRLFGDNLFLSSALSRVDERLRVSTPGGPDVNAVQDPRGIWQGSFLHGFDDRLQEGAKVDGTYWSRGKSGTAHELRAGVGYRFAETEASGFWPGMGGVIGLASTRDTLGFSLGLGTVGTNNLDDKEIWGLYLQETSSRGNATVNLGLRYDVASGRNQPTRLASNELFPGLLPGRDFQGQDAGFHWHAVAPRLGLAYALGPRKSTVLRASYSRYSDELGLVEVQHTNPTRSQPNTTIGAAQSVTFIWLDDGDLTFEPAEIGPVVALGAADPTRPDFFPNAVDPDLSPPLTDEVVLAVEHALPADLVIGASLTWRERRHLLETERLIFEDAAGPRVGSGRAHRRDDYVLLGRVTGVLPDGSAYSVPVYRLKPGLTWLGGTLLTNGQRRQEYLGATVSVSKSFTRGWMLRGWAQWNRWRWDVDPGSIEDPTPFTTGGDDDGGAVIQDTSALGGSKTSVFLNSRWSFNLTGSHELLPRRLRGLRVGYDLYGREGYPVPYSRRVTAATSGDGIEHLVRVTSAVDSFRNDEVFNVNARLEKDFTFSPWAATVSLDVFNLLNQSTALQRQHEIGIPVGDYLLEAVSPRILRLGLRLRWH